LKAFLIRFISFTYTQAEDFHMFADMFSNGTRCFFTGCRIHGVIMGLAFAASFAMGSMAMMLLVSFKQGATYLATVLLIATLLSTIFWTLFRDWPRFEFHPTYDNRSSIFAVVAVAVTILGLLLFVYVSVMVSPPRSPGRCPRIRSTSVPVPRITRRELFPAAQRQRHSTYSPGDQQRSSLAPVFTHRLSAAAHASCARGLVGKRSKPKDMPSRARQDSASKNSLPRTKSSPALLSV
jgi:hypothetical protein